MIPLLLCTAVVLPAQKFVWGAKVGVPVTKVFSTGSGYSSSTTPLTLGPTAELRLPFGLGVEADLLFKRFSYERNSGIAVNSGAQGNSWELPLLAKFRMPGVVLHPYFDGGYSFRTLQGLSQFGSAVAAGNPSELKNNSTRGVVLGAGFEVRVPFLRLSPELRFTHWGSKAFESTGGALSSRQNQLDLLIGVTF